MKNNFSKVVFYTIGTVFALFGVVQLFIGDSIVNTLGVAVADQASYITPTGATLAGQASATTTRTFLSTAATASTTVLGALNNATRLAINVQSTGSSSAATLEFSVDFSDDNIDFFGQDTATTTSIVGANVIPHPTVEVKHHWNVATTSVTGNKVGRTFVLEDLPAAKYYRVRFGTWGANQSIWAKVVPTTEIPN